MREFFTTPSPIAKLPPGTHKRQHCGVLGRPPDRKGLGAKIFTILEALQQCLG